MLIGVSASTVLLSFLDVEARREVESWGGKGREGEGREKDLVAS